MNALRRALAVTGALLISLTALAACGSDDDSSSKEPSSGSISTGPAPTGTPIKIGMLGEYSGIVKSTNGEGPQIAQAWADWKNSTGGINGAPVQVIVEDDQFQPANAVTLAKKLIGQDIVAFAGVTDYQMTAWYKEALDAKVAVVSTENYNPLWYDQGSPLFPIGIDSQSEYSLYGDIAVEAGDSENFAYVYCIEDPNCKVASDQLAKDSEARGIQYTGVGVSLSAVSYIAQCQLLKDKGVDFVALGITGDASTKLIQACATQGYMPKYGVHDNVVNDQLRAVKGLKIYVEQSGFDTASDDPSVKAYTAAAEAAGLDAEIGGFKTQVWQSLEVAAAGIEATQSKTPTRAQVIEGLQGLNGQQVAALINKPNFPTSGARPPGGAPCAAVKVLSDGKLESAGDPVCASAS